MCWGHKTEGLVGPESLGTWSNSKGALLWPLEAKAEGSEKNPAFPLGGGCKTWAPKRGEEC